MGYRLAAALFLSLGSWSVTSGATELLWGFGPADGMPYVAVEDHRLHGGFTHRLGLRVSQRLGLGLRFVETPNKRLEDFIQRGRIHLICNTHPEWLAEPQRYRWSPALYQEEDVLLLHQQDVSVRSLEELYGKVLGTQLGYVYSLPLMEAFARKQVIRKDIRDLDTRLYMLSKQRIDALIDMRRPLQYKLAMHPNLPLHFNSWVVQRYNLHCVYGPQLPVAAERMDEVLQELRDQGELARMLESGN
ncbi:ABC transporter substrate-binding protein [Pseudomonas sp. CrR25]|nr:ABC transporter substrate-binding protein [Pseudomonas sp. CrR25]